MSAICTEITSEALKKGHLLNELLEKARGIATDSSSLDLLIGALERKSEENKHRPKNSTWISWVDSCIEVTEESVCIRHSVHFCLRDQNKKVLKSQEERTFQIQAILTQEKVDLRFVSGKGIDLLPENIFEQLEFLGGVYRTIAQVQNCSVMIC
jgi:hypothetical protein